MATWQYDLQLIPRSKLGEVLGAGYEQALDGFLNESYSWHEDIRNWGDEQGDCISVIREGHEVAEVRVRIDVRELNADHLQNVCEFARRYDCLFLTDDLKLVEPNINLLLHEIAQSDAAAFVTDPVAFLDKIKKRRET